MTTTTKHLTYTTLLAAQTLASAAVLHSSALDVSAYPGAGMLFVDIGRTATTGLTNEIGFKFEGSGNNSDNSIWTPYLQWVSNNLKTAAAAGSTTSGSQAPGTSIVLASGTSYQAGQQVFFNEAAAYEWGQVLSVSGATLTMVDGTTLTHATGINVYTGCERYCFPIPDLQALGRCRMTVDAFAAGGNTAAASGVTTVVRAILVGVDSFLTA